MKNRIKSPLERPRSAWLLSLVLLSAPGCSGDGVGGGSTAEIADPKLRTITESSKNTRDLRKAVVAELKERGKQDQPAKPRKSGRNP